MNISVEAMENFNATATPPISECKKRLEDSQVYLLVIGEMYGTIDKESGLSITEIEYEHAQKLYTEGRIKDLWIIKPTSKYVPNSEHKDSDEEKIRKLKEFREKVCKNVTPRHYDNLDDLKSEIYLQCYVSLQKTSSTSLEKAGINAEGIRQGGIYETKEIRFAHEKKQLPLEKSEKEELELQINEMNKLLKAIGKEEIKREKIDVKSVTMLGNYYYVKQEFEKAQEMYDLVLKYYPDDPRALNNKGSALRAEFQREEACKLFERASKLDPDYTDPKVNLGGILCELERPEEGLKILDEVYKIEKNNPDIALLLNIGFAHSKLGTNKIAHAFYEQAEKLNPKETLVLVNISTLYHSEKNYSKAIEYADKILQIDKKHTGALTIKGSCYVELRQYIKGIRYLQESLKIDPNEIVTLVNLGLAYRRLHDYNDRNEWFADWVEMYSLMALKIKENDPMALDHMGWCYNRCRKYDEAILFFNKALSTSSEIGYMMDKAEALLYLEKFDDVLEIVNTLIKKDQSELDLEILCTKYNLLIRMNKIQDADKFIMELEKELTPDQMKIVKIRKSIFGKIVTT